MRTPRAGNAPRPRDKRHTIRRWSLPNLRLYVNERIQNKRSYTHIQNRTRGTNAELTNPKFIIVPAGLSFRSLKRCGSKELTSRQRNPAVLGFLGYSGPFGLFGCRHATTGIFGTYSDTKKKSMSLCKVSLLRKGCR